MTETNSVKKISIISIGIAFCFALLLPVVVSAHGNGNHDHEGDDYVISTREDLAEQRAQERQERAEARVAAQEARAEERAERRQQRRQQVCERHVERINAAMGRLSQQAKRHLGVFDSFYQRVQEFYDSGQLTVDNYDELNQAVAEAQLAAMVEIDALAQLEVQIDCTDPEVVVKVGAFKDSASAARDALKAYRKALVNLISAMRAEAAEQNANNSSDSEGENESETENEGQEQEQEAETENDSEEETNNSTENQ